MNCPTCNSTNIQIRPKQRGPYPLGIVAIFGLPFAMLHQVSGAREYHCDSCGSDFAQRTVAAQIARILLFIFGIGFAVLILLAFASVIANHSP